MKKSSCLVLHTTQHRRPLKENHHNQTASFSVPRGLVAWLWKLTKERCNHSAMHAVVNLIGSLEWETQAFPLFIQFLKLAHRSSQFQEGHVSDYYFNYPPVTVAPCSLSFTKFNHRQHIFFFSFFFQISTKCFYYLRETPEMLPNSIFRFSTSLIWPFSGPFFTFSRPIR